MTQPTQVSDSLPMDCQDEFFLTVRMFRDAKRLGKLEEAAVLYQKIAAATTPARSASLVGREAIEMYLSLDLPESAAPIADEMLKDGYSQGAIWMHLYYQDINDKVNSLLWIKKHFKCNKEFRRTSRVVRPEMFIPKYDPKYVHSNGVDAFDYLMALEITS